jgi:hypothetical protein
VLVLMSHGALGVGRAHLGLGQAQQAVHACSAVRRRLIDGHVAQCAAWQLSRQRFHLHAAVTPPDHCSGVHPLRRAKQVPSRSLYLASRRILDAGSIVTKLLTGVAT